MEKIKLSFISCKNNDDTELTAFVNTNNELYIHIGEPGSDFHYCGQIVLNKATAIKLVKHLKREISFMDEGVNNG